MITCNRCGKANPTDALSCQKCGAPLATDKQEYVLGAKMSAQDQPELPAWLESLRAGERPAAPPASPSSFSAADLIDGGSLPSWMRSERNDASDPGLSGPQNAVRPSAFAAPNTDSGFAPAQGIDASSLIDEQSLPAWMQPEKPQGNISANSLVQSEFVPEWIKSMQPQQSPLPQPTQRPLQQPQQPQNRPASPPPASAQPQRTSPAQGFSARDLVDDQALPEWMLQPRGQGKPNSAPAQGQQGFSASSLIDNDALPQWMREGGQGQAPLRSNPPPSAQFPAQPAPPAPSYNANAVWQGPAQTPPPSGMPGMPPQSDMPGQGQGASISASSFIDPNVLPEWLRNADDAFGERRPGQARPGAYSGMGAQGRIENVRVPSRPRAEVGPSGDNEAAANAFASMLGVASNAPQFPQQPGQPGSPMATGLYGSPSGQGQGAPQGMPGQSPNTPRAYAGTGPQPTPGMQPQGYMGTGPQSIPGYTGQGIQSQGYAGTGPQATPGFMGQSAQPQGYAGMGAQPAPGGYNSGYMGNAGNLGSVGVAQGGYGSATPPMGQQGQQSQGGAMGYMGQGGPDDQKMNAKPAKRGLFDAIRSLFFRS